MKYCSKCGKQANEPDAFCAGCGQQFPPPVPQKVVAHKSGSLIYVLAGLLILVLIIFASLPPPPRSAAPANATGPDHASALEVTQEKWDIDKLGTLSVIGTVHNNSAAAFGAVKISYKIFDNTGARMGTAWDIVSSLDPHSDWKFRAVVSRDGAEKFELESLTGSM